MGNPTDEEMLAEVEAEIAADPSDGLWDDRGDVAAQVRALAARENELGYMPTLNPTQLRIQAKWAEIDWDEETPQWVQPEWHQAR